MLRYRPVNQLERVSPVGIFSNEMLEGHSLYYLGLDMLFSFHHIFSRGRDYLTDGDDWGKIEPE